LDSINNDEAILALIKKFFPNETCSIDNLDSFRKRLALKNERQLMENIHPETSAQAKSLESLPETAGSMARNQAQPRSYTAEKIVPAPNGSQPHNESAAIFRRMRELPNSQRNNWYYYGNEAELFCQQAAFMVDYTDNFQRETPFEAYYPTYKKMDNDQLRTYFTWRAKIRNGKITYPCSYAYALCYVNELINDIGVENPGDAISKMIAIWREAHKFTYRLNFMMKDCIRDYYVTHSKQLTTPFMDYAKFFPVPYYEHYTELMSKAKACSWDDLWAIELSSSFRITTGSFYKSAIQRRKEIIEKCACHVIRRLGEFFQRNGIDFRKLFVVAKKEPIYTMFRGAVYKHVPLAPFTVKLTEFEAFSLNQNKWYWHHIVFDQYKSVVGYILKYIEVKLRICFKSKSILQLPEISHVKNCFINSEAYLYEEGKPTINKIASWKAKAFALISSPKFEAAIVSAINEFFKAEYLVVSNSEVKVVKPVEIDLDKLPAIEKAYMETAAKLIVDEDAPETGEGVKAGIEAKAEAGIATKVEAGSEAGIEALEKEACGPAPPSLDDEPEAQADAMAEIDLLIGTLTPDERDLLAALLLARPVPANCELMVEAVNEKALEALADNIIDFAEGKPYIYEEYSDELKARLETKKP